MSTTTVTAEQVLDQLADLARVHAGLPLPQGDVIAIPAGGQVPDASAALPQAGARLVEGRGGHVHLLLGRVFWDAEPPGQMTLGVLTVPPGEVACLAHGDGTPASALAGDAEHAPQLIGPGTYVLRRQREQADQARLVAD